MVSHLSRERLKDFLHRYRLHIAVGSIIFLLAVGSVVFSGSTANPSSSLTPSISPEISRTQHNANVQPSPVITLDNQILFKVGLETIYQNDLRFEEASYPFSNQDSRALLTKKLIDDSVILQGGAQDGIISLTPAIFNTPTKDYARRIDAVETVRKTIQNKAKHIEGSVINIWFLNDRVGPLGYEKSKALALEKISTLQKKVNDRTITIDQTAQMIIDDQSLSQLDPQYKTNAMYTFSTNPGERISWEPSFDQAMQQLPLGQTSEIFTGKSPDLEHGGVIVEAYYMFGQVTSRVTSGPDSFVLWLADQKKLYAVTY